MKTYYRVSASLVVEAADDDIAREIVYDNCKITGMEVHIRYTQLAERESTDDNNAIYHNE